jgi:PIN domain nuclease of toxin-antitoxin system
VTILDTHAWLWWVAEPARLGRAARRTVETAKRIGVPAICCLEVATLAIRGRITLDRPILEWLNDALAASHTELISLTPAIAVKAAELPAAFPGDPADRLIVATAIVEAGALVTKDERIRQSGTVRVVWS